jgi:hypothetical protein
VGPIDVFVDEDVAYVEKLNAHGVACELLPKEGRGFSNDDDASLSLPDFKEASFTVDTADKEPIVNITYTISWGNYYEITDYWLRRYRAVFGRVVKTGRLEERVAGALRFVGL